MSIREFLRGGYRTIDEATIVMRHSQQLFTVMPHTSHQNPVLSPQNAPERQETPKVVLRTVRNRTRGS
jgi:hypothetical protein